MAWSKTQKQLAIRACREAGISEDQRVDMILRNFQRAHYKGDITSTSPKLTDSDFANFMAIVERHAGGKVLRFSAGHWDRSAADWLSRMRGKAVRIARALELAAALKANGEGLAGWIRSRVSQGETNRVEELDYHGLLALILGLTAFARQRGVSLAESIGTDEAIGVGENGFSR